MVAYRGGIRCPVKPAWMPLESCTKISILRWFGKTEGKAGSSYRKFIQKGVDQGRQPELVGGGLIRSMGGWSQVKPMRFLGMPGSPLCSGSWFFFTIII